ncbi:MAG TPA: aerial mycelium formation protein [Mycobacteriales bacterium]|nr:aerial mycelium formation protein [Mycobacteriales bacterium]
MTVVEQGSTGGNRRIDRVLRDDYLGDVDALTLADLRARRDEAEQEEADVSYLRRLVQGRIDILRAELARRGGEGTGSLLADLPQILGESGPRSAPRGLGRHSSAEPSRADEHRRYVESLVADVDLSDVAARSDEELRTALGVFEREESDLSDKRRRIFDILDRCSAEITRRYRDGEADVADLLTGGPPAGV